MWISGRSVWICADSFKQVGVEVLKILLEKVLAFLPVPKVRGVLRLCSAVASLRTG